ncbi:type II restriction enzyme [Litorimonas taeanensis]|uniref:Type II restriction enzyme n=1 Tax=Litorimonas taeanensis TaxID=568099 RepID=A0A420WLH0_9PROT|nr:HpaII family restriction endonuclease [Litorimonas taeanensis]RKQ71725.1 type II restriction enzyme [Litorimonas taeanensis]
MSETKNKGEWSEFYAFLKILRDRKLVAAHANLEPIRDTYYPVLQVLRDSKDVKRRYELLDTGQVKLTIEENLISQELLIEPKFLKESVQYIFKNITESKGRAFKIRGSEEIVSHLKCGDIKANSSKKGDITLVIHDSITQQNNTVDFSIKSYAGAAPTLLNASGSTRFRYAVNGFRGNKEDINNLNPRSSKVQARFLKVLETSDEIRFSSMLNKNFAKNLIKLDSLMPLFISEYLRFYFLGYGNSLEVLTSHVASSPRIKEVVLFPISEEDLKYKLKQLLLNVALGLVPSKEWNGFLKADGGYIIVKETGDIVCFHIYNTAELGEYLYHNTRFDTGSTRRNKFATIFKEENQWFFDLNLQISFKK